MEGKERGQYWRHHHGKRGNGPDSERGYRGEMWQKAAKVRMVKVAVNPREVRRQRGRFRGAAECAASGKHLVLQMAGKLMCGLVCAHLCEGKYSDIWL